MALPDRHASPPAGREVFRTDRLVVRTWCAADEPALLALYSTHEVVRWIDDGAALSARDAARWMDVTRANYRKRGYGMFAIEGVDGGATIGFGGLVHPGDQPDAEVKYAFAPHRWGQGLGTEFVTGLLGYATAKHGLTRIIATVAQANVASQRVLLKSGFSRIGTRADADGSRTEVFALRR